MSEDFAICENNGCPSKENDLETQLADEKWANGQAHHVADGFIEDVENDRPTDPMVLAVLKLARRAHALEVEHRAAVALQSQIDDFLATEKKRAEGESYELHQARAQQWAAEGQALYEAWSAAVSAASQVEPAAEN